MSRLKGDGECEDKPQPKETRRGPRRKTKVNAVAPIRGRQKATPPPPAWALHSSCHLHGHCSTWTGAAHLVTRLRLGVDSLDTDLPRYMWTSNKPTTWLQDIGVASFLSHSKWLRPRSRSRSASFVVAVVPHWVRGSVMGEAQTWMCYPDRLTEHPWNVRTSFPVVPPPSGTVCTPVVLECRSWATGVPPRRHAGADRAEC